MKKIWACFKGVQKPLKVILIIVVVIIALIDLIIRKKISERSFGGYLINLIYTLGLSYIASFIFYFVQVHIKEIREREKVLPSIERLFHKLVNYQSAMIKDVINYNYSSINDHSFDEETKEKFVASIDSIKLGYGSLVYQGVKELTWMEYFSYRKAQIEDCARHILAYSQYLNEDCISLLADIRSEPFLFTIIPCLNIILEPSTSAQCSLYALKSVSEEFYALVLKTRDYYYREFEPYKIPKMAPLQAIYLGDKKQITI